MVPSMVWPLFLLLSAFVPLPCSAFNDVFDEELLIKPLPDGFVYSYFQFTTRWQLTRNDSLLHTHLVSRSLAELFHHYDVSELHLSFTSGIWRYENWGFPVVDAGPGAEVWAWFNAGDDREVDARWKQLCGTLSGLFCASLSFVDGTNTFRPEYSLRPQTHRFGGGQANKIRYAALPREIVCTENLTPWKKLLPCKLREGFASLLTPDHVYSGNYHSLALHVRKLCENAECSGRFQLEVRQSVGLVQDQRLFGGKDWSVRKLFGQGLEGACTLAASSKLYVDVTDRGYEMTQAPSDVIRTTRGGASSVLYEYDIKQFERKQRMFNVAAVDRADPNVVSLVQPPPIYSKRFISGVGQERGRIVTRITNTHWTDLNLIIFENIPWFVPIYLHTLKITQGPHQLTPRTVKYIPGRQRERPSQLEIALTIPKRSTLELSIDFDYIFLKWQEYPPDASHGHYLQPSIISVLLPTARNYTSLPREAALFRDSFNATQPEGYFLQLRTEALLLTLPIPDFSMPYNVICLACTVVALAFGPIHNISTKKIVAKSKEPAKPKLSEKIRGWFGRKGKKKEEEEGEGGEVGDKTELDEGDK
uniref:Putative gpi transamidase complex n=1 Tax=Culex tarsalis TaxID=7177 RepID=A0A1Q3FBX1_CULTA